MKILIADTETTGLIANSLRHVDKQPKMTEFFGLMCDEDGNETNELHQLFNVGKKLDKKITRLTGISDEMLEGQPEFHEKAAEVKALLESADEIWFHNASFDVQILNFEFIRAGVSINWPRVRCSVEETEWIKGYRLKEGDLYEHLFDERFTGAHRADVDVRHLKRCIFELKERNFV